MALRSDWSVRPCPIARAIDVLGDPWVLLVLRELSYGVHRFEDIRANIEANDKTLADRLDRMMTAGLVRRQQYSGTVRPRYEYFASPAGEDALPILHALALWGAGHTEAPSLAVAFAITCQTCGSESRRAETCPTCGVDLTPENTRWTRPVACEPDPAGSR